MLESEAARKIRMPLLVAVAAVLFLSYAALIWKNIVFAVGGSDSSGYFNAARMFAAGKTSRAIPIPPELEVKNPNAFVPLGFVRLPGTSTMASFYPPGFPLHMLVAAWLAGWDHGPFYVSPLATLAALALVFLLARRFVRAELALFAAACLAGCAVFIYQGLQPMSDAVATAWCTAAVAACLWERGGVAPAVLAGAALGMAVLVRPTSLLMLAPLLLLLRPRQYLRAVMGGVPFAMLLFWYNVHTFGSPLVGGYSAAEAFNAFELTGALTRAGDYLWRTIRQLGPFVLIASLASLWIPYAAFRIRAGLVLWFVAFLFCYSLYDVNGAWWYTRYLLPAYPALVVMTAATIESLLRRRTWPSRVTAACIAAITLGVIIAMTVQLHVFTADEEQSNNRFAGEWLAQNIPPESLLVSMEMSGATLAYTSHYPVRWDRTSKQELEQWIETAAGRGRGTWALLMPHELPDFQARCGDPGSVVRELPGFQVFRLDSTER